MFSKLLNAKAARYDHTDRQSRRTGPDRPDRLVVLDRPFTMIKQLPNLHKPSWLQRAALTVTSVLAIGAGIVLASALFTLLLVAGLAAAGWLWWKVRQFNRQTERAAPDIIDGDYTVELSQPLLEDQREPSLPPRKKRSRSQ